MQKLYIKIVIAIWGVMTLSAAIAVLVLRLGPQTEPGSKLGRLGPRQMIADVIAMADSQTRGEGEAAFVGWFEDNEMLKDRMLVSIVRDDGEPLYSSAIGPAEDIAYSESLSRTVSVSRPEGIYEVFAAPTMLSDKVSGVSRVQRSIVRAAFQPQLVWWLLLVAVPLSILFSVVVARYLVSPLREFERAGKQLASGDLNARVSPELGGRGDEIAEFAATFDHMAAKVERLVKAHQKLLRDVSHELRTPLSRVLAAASLARKAADNVLAREFDRIEQEVAQLDSMIARLLTYAQLDADELHLSQSVVQFDQLLIEIVEESSLEAAASGRDVSLDILVPCAILGDGQILRSAIENVLRNAIRHTPEDTRVELVLDKLPTVCELTIRDHGPGVAPRDLPNLFEPFYRTDAARTPQSSGGGIGLAIARKAVERHRGTISAENVDGGGLLVRIVLPLHS